MTSDGFSGMTIIALSHLLWLLLLPLGLVCCVRGMERRGFLVVGIVLVVLSIPALWFLRSFWPFDYLGSGKTRMISQIEHAGWRVMLVQTPDVDFYHTDFLVVSPEGWTNEIVYDSDDNKLWRAESAVRGNRIYFFRGSSAADQSPSYLDLERQVFWSGYYRREERMVDPAKEK